MSWQVSEFWRGMIETSGWGIALVWVLKTYDVVRMLPTVTELQGVDWDRGPVGEPSLVVVVPAKDEAETIAGTLEALLMTDYRRMRIVAVDDRSTDGTGEIMEEVAARCAAAGRAERLGVIHITDLPEGWLGKTFAMTVALQNSASDYVLFTDADVLFSPSILRRALAYAEATEADHLVVLPTMQVKSRGEGIVLGFLQVMGAWASRLWRVADPESRRDVVGVGAFNMVRRAAFEGIGGWGPQRLAVLEDVTLGRRMKAAGMRQRIAFAPGLVLVHWAKGARGLLGVMTKNLFSAFGFSPILLAGACLWIGVFCLTPLAGLLWLRTLAPSLVVLCCIAATYRAFEEVSGIDARYGWLYPVGAVGLVGAMLRSMVTVWVQRGVVWRGTRYELEDLRRHNSPGQWERAARRARKLEKRRREAQ
jgi:glycosyltransferase involved in cell wall biosynthesis